MKTFLLYFFIYFSFTTRILSRDCEDLIFNAAVVNGTHRDFARDYFKQKNLPRLLKKTAGQDIPVVLVNSINAELLRDYINSSVGFTVQHQANWQSDHGLVRFGNVLSDADSPGERTHNEIHQTGITWFNTLDNTIRRNPVITKLNYDEHRIEVSYIVTPEQKSAMAYYFTARRAGLFRVKYSYAGKASRLTFPNTFQSGVEHCFNYSKATNLPILLAEVKQTIGSFGINVDTIAQRTSIQNFFELSKKFILDQQTSYSVDDSKVFKHDMLKTAQIDGNDLFEHFKRSLNLNLNDQTTLELMNWFIAYDSITQFINLKSDLGVTNDFSFNDMNHPRASAVLIFDPDPIAYGKFMDGTYQSRGHTGDWTHGNQSPY